MRQYPMSQLLFTQKKVQSIRLLGKIGVSAKPGEHRTCDAALANGPDLCPDLTSSPEESEYLAFLKLRPSLNRKTN